MEIVLNGENRAIEPMSVLQLLQSLELDPMRVAVELNLDILPKAEYGTTRLSGGDTVEIVHFVGGGQQLSLAH